MDPRKLTWCCGCYLEFAKQLHGDDVTVMPCPQPWWPGAVEVYVAGLEPAEGQENTEPGRMVGVLRDPSHCQDGDCLRWLARHGDSGLAYHLACQLGLLETALRASSEFIPAEHVERRGETR